MKTAVVALLLLAGTADASPFRLSRPRLHRGPTAKYTTAPATRPKAETTRSATSIPPRPAELTAFMVRAINRTPAARMPSLCRYVPASVAPVLDRIIAAGQVDACAAAWGIEVQAARNLAVAWRAYRRLP